MFSQRIWIVLCLWIVTVGMAPAASEVYLKAVKFAKEGQDHFAFMHFNNLLRSFPQSNYRQEALFATGEYYFQIAEFTKAAETFEVFLAENPSTQEKLYALGYLLNMASQENDERSMHELEKQIINLQQVSFVFREEKEIKFHSPLNKRYKAVIHINKIEIYVEGELFAQVSY